MSMTIKYLFFLCIVAEKLCYHLTDGGTQCDTDETLITVNTSKFDGEGMINNIVFWDSDANLYVDEIYSVHDMYQGKCVDSKTCYHLFLFGSDDFRVFVDDTVVEEGQVYEDGSLHRIGDCSKKSKCQSENEIFLFAIGDYNFSITNSDGIIDQAYLTEHQARVYCLDPTDCYELRGDGNGYYSKSYDNVLLDQGDAKYKRFGSDCISKCDKNPLLTDSYRGQDITVKLGSMSGMQSMSDIDSPEYKAAW